MTSRIARTALALSSLAAALAAWAQDFNASIELPTIDEAHFVDQMTARVQEFNELVGILGPTVVGGANAGAAQASAKAGEMGGMMNDPVSDMGAAASARQELNGAFDGLADSDRQAEAAFENDPGPSVPSSCAGTGDCNACYAPAVEKIDFNRYWLLRARILTVNTVKVGKAGLAMLDAVSGVAQGLGPVIQAGDRPAIESRLTTLRAKYEAKAAAYLSGLETGMRALGECEAQHFGTRDWYQRYGYLYVSFMRERFATAPE